MVSGAENKIFSHTQEQVVFIVRFRVVAMGPVAQKTFSHSKFKILYFQKCDTQIKKNIKCREIGHPNTSI